VSIDGALADVGTTDPAAGVAAAPGSPSDHPGPAPAATGGPTVTLEGLVVATFALFGLRIGLRPLSDNSLLLHLRTGIDLAATGRLPARDPYSFTAAGHPWVVQSWLAEATYGVAYRIGGLHAVVLEQGLLVAAVALTVALLARTGMASRTMASAGIAVGAGMTMWSQRPLLFGLLGLALLILVVERRRSPWWLLPIGWVWVNTHGSFPLGALWLGALWVGSALDGRGRPRWLEPYMGAFAAALALGALNPVGPRLLSFPLTVGDKRAVFQYIVEWRSPNFQTTGPLVTLAFFGIALVLLVRRPNRWSDTLPVVGFLALGLISSRNLAAGAVVLAPVVARALSAGGVAAPVVAGRARVNRLILAVLAAAAVIFAVGAQGRAALDLRSYPTGAEAYLNTHGLLVGHRIAAQDFVGDYRALVEGSHGSGVFVDDRYDMYPAQVAFDYNALLTARPSALAVLNRWNIDEIVWARDAGLPDELRLAGGWRTAWSDPRWVVLVRDPSVGADPAPAGG